MTDLSESNALAKPQAEKLSPEDLALRRRGMAAAIQMLVTVESETETAVHGDGNETEAEGNAIYEAHYAKMQEAVSSYLLALHHQPAAAQAGFVYVLADQLFHTYGGGGTFATTAHERAEFHTNPPLTNTERSDISEWNDLDAPGVHNGKALTPRERAALAQKWRAAYRRVNGTSPLPTTRKDGKARFIRLVRELEQANWIRTVPPRNQRIASEAIDSISGWSPAAREGFAAVAGKWLGLSSIGISPDLDSWAKEYGDQLDEKRFAELASARDQQTESEVERPTQTSPATEGAPQ